MIGLDTNILIRYLTQDDARQAAIANAILERRLSEEDPGFISLVVVVETAWVLATHYGATRSEIVQAIEGLAALDVVVMEHLEDVVAAIEDVRNSGCDFADSLIARIGLKAGCSATLTFDRKAARFAGFQLAT